MVKGSALFVGSNENGTSLYSTAKTINSYEHLKVTDQIVSEVRTWLFTLNFGCYLSKEYDHKDICNDPFSNGILFAELFSFLEKVTLFKLI